MHFVRSGERGKSAIGSRDDALAPDDRGKSRDALRHKLRMLDQHGRLRDHAGDQNLVVAAR
jgi:hypothetical protein